MHGASTISLAEVGRCPYCGNNYRPTRFDQITCGASACRNRRKWERTKSDPKQIAACRARNARWCAKNRNVRKPQPWLKGAPPFGMHLPGGGVTLDVSPSPRWAVELRNTRGLHGMVTGLIGLPHHPTVPQFSLVPWACRFGWGVYSQHIDAMTSIAGRDHQCVLYDRKVTVRCGHLVKIRSPVVTRRGRRRLRIDAITPVLVRHGGHASRATYTAPTADNLRSTVEAWMPRRIGLQVPEGDVMLNLVSRDTQPATVQMGGKFGVTRGWEGSCVVETNATGHWLLEVASRIGLGGRVALGFGRIRVTEC